MAISKEDFLNGKLARISKRTTGALEFLKANPKEAFTAQEVAKAAGYKVGSTSVLTALYRLQKDGAVVHRQPYWLYSNLPSGKEPTVFVDEVQQYVAQPKPKPVWVPKLTKRGEVLTQVKALRIGEYKHIEDFKGDNRNIHWTTVCAALKEAMEAGQIAVSVHKVDTTPEDWLAKRLYKHKRKH